MSNVETIIHIQRGNDVIGMSQKEYIKLVQRRERLQRVWQFQCTERENEGLYPEVYRQRKRVVRLWRTEEPQAVASAIYTGGYVMAAAHTLKEMRPAAYKMISPHLALTIQSIVDGDIVHRGMGIGMITGDVDDPILEPDTDDIVILSLRHRQQAWDWQFAPTVRENMRIFLIGYPLLREGLDPLAVTTAHVLPGFVKRVTDTGVLAYTDSSGLMTGGLSGGAMVDRHGQMIGICGVGDDQFGMMTASRLTPTHLGKMRIADRLE